MAWRAYLAEAVQKDVNSTDLRISVLYYDDSDSANSGVGVGPPPVPPTHILHAKSFFLPADYSQSQIAGVIRAEGAMARAAVADATAINSTFPVGSTVSIP